jgi:hypothetical protein
MKEKKTDLLQGTLDMLVLKALALGPMHGLGVSNRIAQITQGVFQVKPGSLFPALHRMENRNRRLAAHLAGHRERASSVVGRRTHAAIASSIQPLAQSVP